MSVSTYNKIRKLQTAINSRGEHLLYQTSQFWSDNEQRCITKYYIKQAVWDKEKLRYKNVELFSSCNQSQIILFLRDYWYKLNDMELPTDDEKWNGIRNQIVPQE